MTGVRAPLRPAGCAPAAPAARGFSFIEVMVALSMLLVGCLAILPLFALGVQNLSQRRLATDLRRVRPEVHVLVQQEVDRAGGMPKELGGRSSKAYPLSVRDYDVLIEWIPSPFGGPGIWALASIRREGSIVATLPPIAARRSMFDPTAAEPSAVRR